MRDVAIGALLGAVLAVFVHLAAIHSRTHHDAHHATSAIHQALKRAAPRKRFLPFFEGCAPSQTCARNLVERPRSRLEGAPHDASVPPPTDWSSTFAGTELAGAVASAKCAPGAAVNAGHAHMSRGACAYEWLHDAFGRRRIDAEDTCDIIPESSAQFASTLIRETVSNLRSSVTAHVYWTVLDDSRTEAAANMMKAFETIARPSSQPAPSTLVVASVGAKAACAARKAGARTAAWRPPPSHIVEDDAVFMDRALATGGLDGPDIHGKKRTFLGVRGTGGVAPELWRDGREMLRYERSRRYHVTNDTRLNYGARSAKAAALRHALSWRVVSIFSSTDHPKLLNAIYLKTDPDAFFAGAPPSSLLTNLRPGLTCAARFGIDPRPEHQRFVRAARIGGAPTAAVLAFRRDATAARAARVFLHASNALLEAVDASVNEAAVHAAAHGDVLVGCAVAASTGNDWEAWGCSGDIGEEAKQVLRRANLDGEGPLQIQLWDAEQVVSHEHPSILSGATVAIHVRSGNDDLTAANDIRAGSRGGGLATTPYASVLRVAKELGVYPGAIDEFGNRDYFRVDATQHRKYVAVEDTLIATMPPNFHNGERLGTACLSLLAIAYFTGRVAVLPAALHFEKYYYLWEFIDVERSPLKVHFRESHFLSKARSHARRGVNAARVQVREDGTVSVSRVLDDDADDANARVYSRPEQLDPMALAVAAATRDDVAVDADVLYLNVDDSVQISWRFSRRHWLICAQVDEIPTHNALATPHRACTFRPPWRSNGKGCASSGKGAPPWLGLLYDAYGHCTFEAHALRGLGLVTASDDCHAKRWEDARRMRLFDIDPGNRSLVVEKPRGGEAGKTFRGGAK